MDVRGGETALVFLLLLGFQLVRLDAEGIGVGYYKENCPEAETVIRSVVEKAVKEVSDTPAHLLNIYFHDCFIRGCDASILLDSTGGNIAEKDSPIVNLNPQGFDVIEKAKSEVEAVCEGVVSCADILSYATRDALNLSGVPHYEVPGGRLDGLVSKASETFAQLPDPKDDLANLTKLFKSKGFSQAEMITLTGGHSIGGTTCALFYDRLYNFSPLVPQDPSLDINYAEYLKTLCPFNSTNTNVTTPTIPIDPITPGVLDNNIFRDILSHRVVFQTDQLLLSVNRTKRLVTNYAANNTNFMINFVDVIIKLGKRDVVTGSRGEVRTDCRVVN